MVTIPFPTGLNVLGMTYPVKPPEGFKGVSMPLQFTGAIDGYTINLANAGLGANSGFSQVCTLYIDNSVSPGETTVTFVGSGETVSAKPFSRGYYPVNAANLNLVVKNNSSVNASVTMVAYNYIINPVIDNATSNVLGHQDTIVSERKGTIASITEFALTSAGIFKFSGTPFITNAKYPFYYLTSINVNVGLPSSGASAPLGGGLRIVDIDQVSGAVITAFCTANIFQSTGTPMLALAVNLNDVLLTGVGQIGYEQTVAMFGGIAGVTLIGGLTKSPILISQQG